QLTSSAQCVAAPQVASLPKLKAMSRRVVPRCPQETIVSSSTSEGLYAQTSIERSPPPSMSGTDFGPTYASLVTPPKSTPAKPVPPTFVTSDGPPTFVKFPREPAATFNHVAEPAEASDARKSTYSVTAC